MMSERASRAPPHCESGMENDSGRPREARRALRAGDGADSACNTASAPRRNVSPQSPSPTTASSSVMCASDRMSAFAAARMALSRSAASPLSCDGAEGSGLAAGTDALSLLSPDGCAAGTNAPGHARTPVCASARVRARASNPSRRRGHADDGASRRGRRVSETPAIEIDVISAPEMMRRTTMPRAAADRRTARSTTPISSCEVPPTLFTRRMAGSPGQGRRKVSRKAGFVSPSNDAHIRSTVSSAGRRGSLAAPFSPWMPRPISISSPALSEGTCGRPGNWHSESPTLIVKHEDATCAATACTSSSEWPFSERAPAIF
eukprot:Opistho-1_new@63108